MASSAALGNDRASRPLICIGSIVKSHRVSGEFLCRLFSPLQPDSKGKHRLSGLRQIEIRQPCSGKHQKQTHPPLRLESMKLIQGLGGESSQLLLTCSNWQSPEQIKPFHGWELWVEREYASLCAEGEFLYCELVGAKVYARQGSATGWDATERGDSQIECAEYRVLGRVSRLREGAAQLLLEIEPDPQRYPAQEGHKPFYLPFHHCVIGRIQRNDDSNGPPLSMEVLDIEYFEALLKTSRV